MSACSPSCRWYRMRSLSRNCFCHCSPPPHCGTATTLSSCAPAPHSTTRHCSRSSHTASSWWYRLHPVLYPPWWLFFDRLAVRVRSRSCFRRVVLASLFSCLCSFCFSLVCSVCSLVCVCVCSLLCVLCVLFCVFCVFGVYSLFNSLRYICHPLF